MERISRDPETRIGNLTYYFDDGRERIGLNYRWIETRFIRMWS